MRVPETGRARKPRPRPRPPKPDPVLADLWKSQGVFTTNLSAFHDQLQEAARGAGVKWIAVLLQNDPSVEREHAELQRKRRELIARGFQIVGWGPSYDDPAEDARDAASIVRDEDLWGWIVNGEAWWEGDHKSRGPAWLQAWQAQKVGKPLALSCLSSPTSRWARDFLYKPWVDAGVAVMPQVYGNADPALNVANMLETFRLNGVPRSLLAPTFGTYRSTYPVPWADYATWQGPRNYYLGEVMPVETYRTYI